MDLEHPDENAIRRFEKAWRKTPYPNLKEFLDNDVTKAELPTLIEMVLIDMEFRWKHQTSRQTELETVATLFSTDEYLNGFPILKESEIEDRLLLEEFVIRRKFGDQPELECFVDRWQHLQNKLIQLDSQYPIQSREKDFLHSANATQPSADFPAIPNFQILSEVGQGGMGSVYLAMQQKPVRRRVALKLIRSEIISEEVKVRFDAERQALALMDHPNIARIYHADATESGRPYFAMEFVDGPPITEFCAKNKLKIQERLELFSDVCNAVHHAHQKGVLHRDLKPSNVLVVQHENRPIVKVIDFGLAKAVEQSAKLTDQTVQTQAGQVIGTLKYMSPEQASVSEKDIDTRTDVFALGVILFELLTGKTPLDDISLHDQGILSILQIIRDHEPIPPSQKLLQFDDNLTHRISVERGTTFRSLHHLLRGDLDWVVMKAMENDRERRYHSAASLADDVQRYLNNETVLAHPQSATYRLKKFVGKNRFIVGTGLAVFLLLVIGIVATASQMIRAQAAEADAKKQTEVAISKSDESEARRVIAEKLRVQELIARKDAEKSRDAATESERRAKNVLDVVVESFRAADPNQGALKDLMAKDVLLEVAKKVENRFSKDPLGEAMLLNALSRSFNGIGELDEAISSAIRAVEIRTRQLGRKNNLTNYALQSLAAAYTSAGQFDKALNLGKEILEIRKNTIPQNLDDIRAAKSNLAVFYTKSGDFPKAIELHREVIKSLESSKDQNVDIRLILAAKNSLGYVLQQDGKTTQAIEIFEQLLQRSKSELGDDDDLVTSIMNHLALCFSQARRYDEAAELHKICWERSTKRFGPTHPKTLTDMLGYATSLGDQRNFGLAVELLNKYIVFAEERLGKNSPPSLVGKNNLASIYHLDGQFEKAIELNKEVLSGRIKQLGKTHPRTLASMNNLATDYTSLGKIEEATELLEDVLSILRKNLGDKNHQTLSAMVNLANCHIIENPAKSEELLDFVYKEMSESNGLEDRLTQLVLLRLGEACQRTNKAKKLSRLYTTAINFFAGRSTEDHATVLMNLLPSKIEADLLIHKPNGALSSIELLAKLHEKNRASVSEMFRMRHAKLIALLLLRRFAEAKRESLEMIKFLKGKRLKNTSLDIHSFKVTVALCQLALNEFTNASATAEEELKNKNLKALDVSRAELIKLLSDRNRNANTILLIAEKRITEIETALENEPPFLAVFNSIAIEQVIQFCERNQLQNDAVRLRKMLSNANEEAK